MTSKGRSLSHQLLAAISAYEISLALPFIFSSESSSLRRSRDEGNFTDLILNHEAGRFNVHKIIVCPQSKVLHKACSGGFEVTVIVYVQKLAEILK